jgi:hypothetical protein
MNIRDYIRRFHIIGEHTRVRGRGHVSTIKRLCSDIGGGPTLATAIL